MADINSFADGDNSSTANRMRQRAERAAAKKQYDQEVLKQSLSTKRSEDMIKNSILWREKIIPRWKEVSASTKVRELTTKGVPPSLRAEVWKLMIGDKIKISIEAYAAIRKQAETVKGITDEKVNSIRQECSLYSEKDPPETPTDASMEGGGSAGVVGLNDLIERECRQFPPLAYEAAQRGSNSSSRSDEEVDCPSALSHSSDRLCSKGHQSSDELLAQGLGRVRQLAVSPEHIESRAALQRLSTGALNNNRGSEGMSISSAGALAASVEPEHKSKHPNRFKFAPVMRRMHKEVKKLKKQSKSASLTEALNTRSSLFGYDHPMGQSDVLGDELGATKSDSSSGSDDGLVYDEAFNSDDEYSDEEPTCAKTQRSLFMEMPVDQVRETETYVDQVRETEISPVSLEIHKKTAVTYQTDGGDVKCVEGKTDNGLQNDGTYVGPFLPFPKTTSDKDMASYMADHPDPGRYPSQGDDSECLPESYVSCLYAAGDEQVQDETNAKQDETCAQQERVGPIGYVRSEEDSDDEVTQVHLPPLSLHDIRSNITDDYHGQDLDYQRDSLVAQERNSDITATTARNKTSTMYLIQWDLPRTFPTLGFFHDGGPMHTSLNNVLQAYSCYRKDIGYVQGMSFIAAMFLLYMPELEAFEALVNVVGRRGCLEFYGMEREAILGYTNMYNYFFKQSLPLLYQHMEEEGVTSEMYLMDWNLSLFCKALPLEAAARIWDCYLLEGEVFILRTALGILRMYAKKLCQASMEVIMKFLVHLPDDIDVDDLLQNIAQIRISHNKFEEMHTRAYEGDGKLENNPDRLGSRARLMASSLLHTFTSQHIEDRLLITSNSEGPSSVPSMPRSPGGSGKDSSSTPPKKEGSRISQFRRFSGSSYFLSSKHTKKPPPAHTCSSTASESVDGTAAASGATEDNSNVNDTTDRKCLFDDDMGEGDEEVSVERRVSSRRRASIRTSHLDQLQDMANDVAFVRVMSNTSVASEGLGVDSFTADLVPSAAPDVHTEVFTLGIEPIRATEVLKDANPGIEPLPLHATNGEHRRESSVDSIGNNKEKCAVC